jgi:hypothetical protein
VPARNFQTIAAVAVSCHPYPSQYVTCVAERFACEVQLGIGRAGNGLYSHHVSGAARPSRLASAADLAVDVNFSNVWYFST